MKKAITLILCALLLVSLFTACEKDNDKDEEITLDGVETDKVNNTPKETDDPDNGYGDFYEPQK